MDQMTAGCDDWTLLYTSSSARECIKGKLKATQISPEAAAKLMAIQDFCVSNHLESTIPDFYQEYRSVLKAQTVMQLIQSEEIAESDSRYDRLAAVYSCGVERMLKDCPVKTIVGYNSCLNNTDSAAAKAAEKMFQECATSAEAH